MSVSLSQSVMSGNGPIDRHVAKVRSKQGMNLFLRAAGVGLGFVAGGTGVAILCGRLVQWHVPGGVWVLCGATAAALAGAGWYAVTKRPGELRAAMEIDNALGLKERLSTAMLMRGQKGLDEFGKAAVADADRVAAGLQVGEHFKLKWPKSLTVALILGAVAGSTVLVPQQDWLGRKEAAVAKKKDEEKKEQVKREVKGALATIEKAGTVVSGDTNVSRAKQELEQLLERPISDPAAAQRSALSALQDLKQAINQKIESNQKYAAAQQERKELSKLMPAEDEKGPVADAQKAIAQGNFTEAVKSMEKAAQDFDNLSKDEQKKQAEQMKAMAQQLADMAQNKGNQQQMAQALQKAMQEQGVNKDQAQQMAQQMAQQLQQAAGGDSKDKQQAQQQLQQMAQQAMQQMNGGQGPTQQQKQAIQQAMQQAQQQAASQANAQQLSQAMQQMAQAMQQQANAGQKQQQGQQGQQQGQQQGSQQAQGQQQQQRQGAPSQSASGQKQSQGQQQGQQAKGGQAGQQGQQSAQSGQSGNNGMQQSLEQMQQALGAMQAIQNDASALDAAANAAQQAESAQAGNCNGQGQGQWKPGGDKPFNGQESHGRGGGQGAGDRSYKAQAPYQVKQEKSPSQNNENGRILASTLVKAGAIKGESKEQLKEAARSAEQEAAEEVDTERVGKAAQGAVREYFRSLGTDAPKAP